MKNIKVTKKPNEDKIMKIREVKTSKKEMIEGRDVRDKTKYMMKSEETVIEEERGVIILRKKWG